MICVVFSTDVVDLEWSTQNHRETKAIENPDSIFNDDNVGPHL